MRLRLTPVAEQDLVRIFLEGLDRHGIAQAEAYQHRLHRTLSLLAEQPKMGRLRAEFRQPIRSLVIGSHTALYLCLDDEVRVVRIRHHREDWLTD